MEFQFQNPYPPHVWDMSLDGKFRVVWAMPDAPHAFHRLMQRWLLGIHWRKKQ